MFGRVLAVAAIARGVYLMFLKDAGWAFFMQWLSFFLHIRKSIDFGRPEARNIMTAILPVAGKQCGDNG